MPGRRSLTVCDPGLEARCITSAAFCLLDARCQAGARPRAVEFHRTFEDVKESEKKIKKQRFDILYKALNSDSFF